MYIRTKYVYIYVYTYNICIYIWYTYNIRTIYVYIYIEKRTVTERKFYIFGLAWRRREAATVAPVVLRWSGGGRGGGGRRSIRGEKKRGRHGVLLFSGRGKKEASMGSPGFSRYFSTVHGSRSLVFPTTSGRAYYRRPKGMVSLVHGRVLGGSPLSLKGQLPHSRELLLSILVPLQHRPTLFEARAKGDDRERERRGDTLHPWGGVPATPLLGSLGSIPAIRTEVQATLSLPALPACLPACLPARLPKPAVQVSLENSNGLLPNPSTSRDAFQIVRHDYTTDCSTCHASWTPLSSNTRSIISRPTFSRGGTRKKRDWGSVVAALFGGGGASSSVRRATSRWNLLEIRLEFSRENWKIVQRLNYNYNFNLIFIVI